MKYKRTIGSMIYDVVIYAILIILALVTLFPFVNVLAKSLSDTLSVTMGYVTFFPKGFNLNSYAIILRNSSIWRAYAYTILYATVGTVISVSFTAMLAYPLSIKDFGLKKAINILLVITMFFGGGLIPTYLLMRKLHMINTLSIMVLPMAVSAWNVFVYRTFFQSIPSSLRESGIIDGANEFIVFFRIYVPLSKALFATMALFSIVAHWNNFFQALIYLTDSKKYPLQMILRRILNELVSDDRNMKAMMVKKNVSSANIQSATIIFTALPVICIYPFLQKHFTKGIMIGSIKG